MLIIANFPKPIILIIISAAILALSCNNLPQANDGSKERVDTSVGGSEAYKTDFRNDSSITIPFPKDSNSVTITGSMKGIDRPVTVNIPVLKSAKLSVALTPPDSIANVRINQIYLPDGKADGPFGRAFSRKITQKGTCTLIIGENLMQGEEWKGSFTLTIKLEP